MINQTPPGSPRRTAALAACLCAFAAPAIAQNSQAPTQHQVDEAFRAVVANADSAEARARYATLLVGAGNFEGGIAALEGLLLSPDAPASIRVELGVLYYRLGSYAIAETYLRAALDDPRLGAAHKTQAGNLLRDVLQRNRSSQLSGSVMIGVRAQSNPTAASDRNEVLSLGNVVRLNQDNKPKSDTDTLIWGRLDHAFDLDRQNEAALVTSLVGYANHFNSVDSYTIRSGNTKPFDLAVLAGSTGIRFKPSPLTNPTLTVRPHLLFGGASANGHNYFTAGGVGIDGAFRSSETVSWSGSYERRHFSYAPRDDIANSSLQNGIQQIVRLRSAVETAPNRFLTAELGYVDHDGSVAYTAFRGPEAKLSYVLAYKSPFAEDGAPWTTTLSAGALRREYRGADPAVDARTARRDTEWRTSLVNTMPLSRDIALQIQIEYTRTPSSLPNYRYANTAGTLGLIWTY